MIRIVFVIPTLDRSGAERQLTLLAERLPREDFDPHIIALTRGGPYEQQLAQANVPVTVLRKRFRFDPFAWLRLRKQLKSLEPDIVHSWLFSGNTYSRLVRRDVVCSERCVDSWKSGWQLWLDRRLARRTRTLLANSAAVAEFYRNHGVPAELIRVIPNGFVDNGMASTAERTAMREEFGLPADSRVVVYAGRFARQKRVHDLVWAFQLLRQTIDNTYLLLIGDGPELDRIEQRIKHFEISRLVRCTGHRDDAEKLMRAGDAFWLGSDFEGMSNSLAEAMMAGLPCIASDIPPNGELIEHGQNGYLVKAGDAQAFQQFTLDLLNDAAAADKIGAAARRSILDRFSVERMVDAHVTLYRELFGGGRPCAD